MDEQDRRQERADFRRRLADNALCNWVMELVDLNDFVQPSTEPQRRNSHLRELIRSRNSRNWNTVWDLLEKINIHTLEEFTTRLSPAELLALDCPYWHLGHIVHQAKTRGLMLVTKPPWKRRGSLISALGQNGKGANPWKHIAAMGITHLGQLEHLKANDLLKIEGIGPAGVILVRTKMAEEDFHFADEQ